MSRRAGRVFVSAPLSYLLEDASHTQDTWDAMTSRGENDSQRKYVIHDKVAAVYSTTKGRKPKPPSYWLDDSNDNTLDVWNALPRCEQKRIRIHFTTGKYRKLIDKRRKDDKELNVFTTEKRGRPSKVSHALAYIFDEIKHNRSAELLHIFNFIDPLYHDHVQSLFGSIVDNARSIINNYPDITFHRMATLLITSKIMNIRIKALNAIWDRTKGIKANSRSRRFKLPIGYTNSTESWTSMTAIEQLFHIYKLELTRYIELNDEHSAFISDFLSTDHDPANIAPIQNDNIDLCEFESICHHTPTFDEREIAELLTS